MSKPSSKLAADEIIVRELHEQELPAATAILQLAFGTFVGAPDPATFMADRDYVRTRWVADPRAALALEHRGRLIGTNFVTSWGSVGFFGPLTVDPEYWDRGVAQYLLAPTMENFKERGTRHLGLYTFSQSTKHSALYQKFGFWPRFLTAVMEKPVGRGTTHDSPPLQLYSELTANERGSAVDACRELTGAIYEGLDVAREIYAVEAQQLGDTILLSGNDDLNGFAVCHCGTGTEAGTGVCYVKFGAVRSHGNGERTLKRLVSACEQFAVQQDLSRLAAGVNLARHTAYRVMLEFGFRTTIQGVAMHCPNEPAYSHPGAFVIDDWR